MRRKDREITDIDTILEIIRACPMCCLGLCVDGMPYVVPLNFGLEVEDGKAVIYFHGAKDGKKLDIIDKNPNACFTAATMRGIVPGGKPDEYTTLYESVMGFGCVEVLEGADEKRKGLASIMRHNAPEAGLEFSVEAVDKTAVLRLVAEELTGKRNYGTRKPHP